jgi:hypothetical protein
MPGTLVRIHWGYPPSERAGRRSPLATDGRGLVRGWRAILRRTREGHCGMVGLEGMTTGVDVLIRAKRSGSPAGAGEPERWNRTLKQSVCLEILDSD